MNLEICRVEEFGKGCCDERNLCTGDVCRNREEEGRVEYGLFALCEKWWELRQLKGKVDRIIFR